MSKKNMMTQLEMQATRMHTELAMAEKNLEQFIAIGHSANGFVHVKMDGYHHVTEIDIDSKFWHCDKAQLCQQLVEACNDASERVDDEIEKKMSVIVYDCTRNLIES